MAAGILNCNPVDVSKMMNRVCSGIIRTRKTNLVVDQEPRGTLSSRVASIIRGMLWGRYFLSASPTLGLWLRNPGNPL